MRADESSLPGWHWATDVKPIAGTESCRYHHLGVCVQGRLGIRMDDGTTFEVGPNSVFDIPAGHDGWVIGDDPWYNPAKSADPSNPDPQFNPGNQVNLYHFHVGGAGPSALLAEVFAGRIGSPLTPGLSTNCSESADITLVSNNLPITKVTADNNVLDVHLTLAGGQACVGCKVQVAPDKSKDKETIGLNPVGWRVMMALLGTLVCCSRSASHAD